MSDDVDDMPKRVPESEDSPTFDQQLLTDDAKWWEFLDPDTYQKPEGLQQVQRTTSDQLDWSRTKDRRRTGPVGFSFFHHCSDCGQGVPPDFTFCVHCGGQPRWNRHPKMFTLVVADFDDDHARRAATELVVRAGRGLKPAEVEELLSAPPAVFNVYAARDQVAALAAKLAEVGVRARGFAVDDPSVPWVKETVESVVRQTSKLALASAIVLMAIAGTIFWSLLAAVLGVVALAAFFVRELRWYRNRYELDVDRMLELVTGFDEGTALVARDALSKLSDRKVRGYVTACLMEYYTLTQQLRAHGNVFGAVLEPSKAALEELMADVLRLAHRYAQLDDFIAQNPPAALEQRIGRLQDGLPEDPTSRELASREIAALKRQLETTQSMDASREHFRDRLRLLSDSMESLRRRIAAVRANPTEAAWREIEMDAALEKLEAEFEVFEETFAVIEA